MLDEEDEELGDYPFSESDYEDDDTDEDSGSDDEDWEMVDEVRRSSAHGIEHGNLDSGSAPSVSCF